MKHIRWYDKNPDLKNVFEFIQELDTADQRKIAHDILQILFTDFNINLDEKINEVAKNYNYKAQRWYDNNIDLYTSFEIIKGQSSVTKSKIIEKIVESILYMYFQDEGKMANVAKSRNTKTIEQGI